MDVLTEVDKGSSTVVPVTERSDIACEADLIRVFLPEAILPHAIGRNVTWRENSCELQYNGTHYIGSVILSDCGSTVKIEEQHVTFTNDIIIHTFGISNKVTPADNDVTFGEDYETVIPVECIYPRENRVFSSYVPIKQHIRFFEKRFGELDLDMQQYESENYDKLLVSDLDSPRQIPLDSDVFMRIGFKFDTQKLRLDAHKCIATTTASPADAKWYSLIENGCPTAGTRILSSGSNSSDVRFAFKAFDFRQGSSGLVYIHCEVSVCGVNDAGCQTGCQSRDKRSALGTTSKGSHLVSMGPFVVQHDEGSSAESIIGLPTVFAIFCLLVAMVAVVVAVIGWTKKQKEEKIRQF